tara:strand:- start:7763 stop:9064 length:1302 start_codon:yes stop_codon:yes gene_type:complete
MIMAFAPLVVVLLLMASIALMSLSDYSSVVFISGLACIVPLFWCCKKYGVFDPRSLLVIMAIPYLLAAPIDIFIFGNTSNFGIDAIAWLTLLGFVFLAFFMFGVSLISFRSASLGIKVETNLSYPIVIFFLVIGLVFYIYLIAAFFSLSVGSLSRADIYGSKPLVFDLFTILFLYLIVFFIWCFVFPGQKGFTGIKFLIGIMVSYIFIGFVFMGDRGTGVTLLVLFFYFYSLRNQVSRRVLFVLFFFSIVLLLYSSFRNVPVEYWLDIYRNMVFFERLNPARLEFGAFPIVWQDYFNEFNLGFHPTYYEIPFQIIPSALFPERGDAPSVWFVKHFYPDIANVGGGMAFNAILESVMNFWVLGPVFLGFVLGVSFSWLLSYDWDGRFLVGAWLIESFSFFMRVDMVNVVRSQMIASLVFVLLFLIFCRVKVIRR